MQSPGRMAAQALEACRMGDEERTKMAVGVEGCKEKGHPKAVRLVEVGTEGGRSDRRRAMVA